MAPRKTTEWLTVQDILDELGIGRRTWQRWRARKCTPRYVKLPGGELRIRRSDFEAWLAEHEVDVA